ncbi:MerR family transcriptional regulator [Clostridium oryzae]|uniref:HTH-type transcriptional regulator AdhR n=1 Tax=Clostridium oryzae TaxID=1450648 RepID=A0A1V4IQG4_9CLOT|nr:MerR family transcriptional regulator [Clostridium oryzae]OPJ62143.1 HTH-type transcriptional regulator AdhR [Clostridium oryzae]
MYIGEFSNKTGLSIDTLRYYDKLGILCPEKLNGKRQYYECDIEIAKSIKKLRHIGFSLKDIGSIVNFDKVFDNCEPNSKEFINIVNSLKELLQDKYKYILKLEQDIAESRKSIEKMLAKLDIINEYKR